MEKQKPSLLPKVPDYSNVIGRDGRPLSGYGFVDNIPDDSEFSCETYIANIGNGNSNGFLNTRFEPMDNDINGMGGNGFKTIQFGGRDNPAKVDANSNECCFSAFDSKKPVVLLKKESSGMYRLHLSNFELDFDEEQTDAYKKWIDVNNRGGVAINLSLPFTDKNDALDFLGWLKSDFENRMKLIIKGLVPQFSEWSNAWKLNDGFEGLDDSLIIEEVKKVPAAKDEKVTKQTRGKLFGIFGG